jgi:hypothetical protein
VNNWRIVSQERKRKEIFSDILGIATAKDSSSKKEVKKEAKTEVKQEEVKEEVQSDPEADEEEMKREMKKELERRVDRLTKVNLLGSKVFKLRMGDIFSWAVSQA